MWTEVQETEGCSCITGREESREGERDTGKEGGREESFRIGSRLPEGDY